MRWPWARDYEEAIERQARRERTIDQLERLVGQMEITVAKLKDSAEQQAHHG